MSTKIKLLVSRAGLGFSQTAGEEVAVDAAEAKRMIAAGQAVALKKERAVKAPKVETATDVSA